MSAVLEYARLRTCGGEHIPSSALAQMCIFSGCNTPFMRLRVRQAADVDAEIHLSPHSTHDAFRTAHHHRLRIPQGRRG